MPTFYIFGITKDDGDLSDPDAAIDKYYYFSSTNGNRYWDHRQNVVNKIKAGLVRAFTYKNGKIGALCVIRKSVYGTEYLKTMPNNDPTDNLSSLPEM
ncbi:DUF3892 domain-containing protein [Candidatus Saccharibacteria bacterium]|nr:DUF3892 domain-containing protein [Candidatus Saccharibacteria bacterium]